MPVSINGNGTITGVSVGGLPDGIVDTDMLAADSVTAPKIGSKTFTSYALICDQKGANDSGGTFSANTTVTRDLNTEIIDADGIVSIAGNQFTLQAGTYFIRASAPAFFVQRHIAWLHNETDGAVVQYGTGEYAEAVNGCSTRSFISAKTTISSAKNFRIKHRCGVTRNSNGLGVSSEYNQSIYTIVEIFKEA